MARDLRQSPAYAAYMRSLGWQAIKGAFIKPIPFLPFTLIKIQRPIRLPNLAVLKKFRPVYISYEPQVGSKPPKSFKPSTPLLPSKTIRLNLTLGLTRLLAGMHPKTRYNLKKHRMPVTVFRGDKVSDKILKQFFQIYRNNSRRQHFWGVNFSQLKSLVTCFGKNAYLFFCHEGGLLILVYDKVAYYSHNAATLEGRKQFAPTILTWEAIKLSKKLKCHRFDFEGITDERFRLTRKWAGFTRFKQGFGGKEISYPGAFARLGFPLASSENDTRS